MKYFRYVVLAAAGGFGLFYLPFLVPVSQGTDMSYHYGFNNRVSILTLLVILLVSLLFIPFRRLQQDTLDTLYTPERTGEHQMSRRVLWIWLIVYLLICVYAFGLWRHAHWFFDLAYYQYRILDHLQGMVPYRQYEFAYGPLFVIIPSLLVRLLAPLGVGAYEGYGLTYLFFSLAGLGMLFWFLQRFRIAPAQKVLIFNLTAVFGWLLVPNITYILLLRYFIAAFLLMWLHDTVQRVAPGRRGVWPAVIACLSPFIGFGISPEVGVAVTITFFVYGANAVTRDRALTGQIILGVLLAPVFVILCFRGDYFHTLLSFSSGGANLPVFPSIPVFLYIGTLLVVTNVLLRKAIIKQQEFAPLSVALALLCVLLIPGALSRADISHVLFYGLIPLLLTLLLLAPRHPVAFRRLAIAVFILFALVQGSRVFQYRNIIAGNTYLEFGRYLFPVERVAALARTVGFDEAKIAKLRERMQYAPPDHRALFADFPPTTQFAIPFQIEEEVYADLNARGQVLHEYFFDTYDLFSQAHLERKIADLSRAEYVVLYNAALDYLPPTRLKDTVFDSLMLYMYPIAIDVPIRPAPDMYGEIVRYVKAHYTVVKRDDNYCVLRKMTPERNTP